MSTTLLIILGVALLLSLIAYIVARVRLSKGLLVLSTGRLDVTLLMLTPLLAIIGVVVYKILPFPTLAWILWIAAGVCLILSCIYSILENKNSAWDIIFSIGAKIFIVVTTVFIITLSLVVFMGYLIYYLIREYGRADDDDASHHIQIPKYRKFMNAYVGLQTPPKKEVTDVQAIEINDPEDK